MLPKPTALKIAEGSLAGFPPTEPVPKPPADLKPPVWIDAAAKKLWKKIAPEYTEIGLLTALDSEKLACYCQAIVTAQSLSKNLQKNGTFVTAVNKKGFTTEQHRPAWQQWLDAVRLLDKLGVQFGDSPAARARLGRLADEEAEDQQLMSLVGAKPA